MYRKMPSTIHANNSRDKRRVAVTALYIVRRNSSFDLARPCFEFMNCVVLNFVQDNFT
jgi:hypothetical protein